MTESAALAAKLRAEGEKLADFMISLSAEQWAVEVYTEGSVWTIRSIMVHLMTAERAFLKLFEQIMQGGPGVSEDFVIDRYNASQQAKAKDLDRHELLERYRSTRARMVALVLGFRDADLEKIGRHPFLGVTALREMVKMIYIHNQAHLRDARRCLKVE
jgi:hypothetical protein